MFSPVYIYDEVYACQFTVYLFGMLLKFVHTLLFRSMEVLASDRVKEKCRYLESGLENQFDLQRN